MCISGLYVLHGPVFPANRHDPDDHTSTSHYYIAHLYVYPHVRLKVWENVLFELGSEINVELKRLEGRTNVG